MNNEGIVRVPRAKVCYTACDDCMGKLVRQMRNHDSILIKHGDIIARDLDHIYIDWLRRDKQNVIRVDCPHGPSYLITQNRYYIPGNARLHLGEPIVRSTHDYQRAGLLLIPSSRIRGKILDRYSYLSGTPPVPIQHYAYFDDSDEDLSYSSTN